MRFSFIFFIVLMLLSLSLGFFVATQKAEAQVTPCSGNPACPGTKEPEEGFSTGGAFVLDNLLFDRAIVPCGRKCDDGRTGYDETCNCTLCHLLIMAKNIFDLLLAWLVIVTLVMLTVAGVLFILSSGNAGVRQIAKTIVARTLTGFAIFLLSWLIIYTALVFMSAEGGGMLGLGATANWYEFTCNTDTSPFN